MSGNFRSVTFWIPGTPRGQGRPEVTANVRYKVKDPLTGETKKDPFTGEDLWETRSLRYPIVRADPQTRAEAKRIRKIARSVMRELGLGPIEGPVFLALTAVFTMPPSWTAKKKATTVWHTDKPDSTNIVKLVEDAGNQQQARGEWAKATEEELRGVLWIDDSGNSCVCVRKVYGSQEGSLVTVAELDPSSLELRPFDCQGVSWPIVPEVKRVLRGSESQLRLDCDATETGMEA